MGAVLAPVVKRGTFVDVAVEYIPLLRLDLCVDISLAWDTAYCAVPLGFVGILSHCRRSNVSLETQNYGCAISNLLSKWT